MLGPFAQVPLRIDRNGFLLVYISDEQHRKVFFDNVTVEHVRGRLLEENHYYPFGLTLRTVAPGGLATREKYQGKELQEELGMELYDFHARQYDPQIGRFWGIDPADQFPSGYTGIGNDPANLIDPTGMETEVSPMTDVADRPRKFMGGNGDSGFGDIDALKEYAWYAMGLYGEEKESLFPGGGMSGQGEQYIGVGSIGGDWKPNAGWLPLTKEALAYHYQTYYCPDCTGGTLQDRVGTFFEDLVYQHLQALNYQQNHGNFEIWRNPENRFGGTGEAAIPDFLGMRITHRGYNGTPVNGKLTTAYEVESFFEVNATGASRVYLSSFQSHLKRQMSAARGLGLGEVIVFTTYGTTMSRSVLDEAKQNKILFQHYITYYKAVGAAMFISIRKITYKYY